MYGIENKDKDMGFGYDIFPDRKKPSICIREGSSIYSLGHFDSEEKAQYFINKVIEVLRADKGMTFGGTGDQNERLEQHSDNRQGRCELGRKPY